MQRFLATALATVVLASSSAAAEPRVLVDGAKLERIAAEPDIVTPIGMAFDPQGRLLIVESHTHQRPENYAGPKGDRLRMFSDSDGDGKLDNWSTFAEGFQQAMNVAVAAEGAVYLVTRRDVHLLRDKDNDGVADSDEVIVRLETDDQYPHNGLGGICLGDDKLYLGLGENHGFSYKLIAASGDSVSGSGGVGKIFSFDLRGNFGDCIVDFTPTVASGFWNPFAICLTPRGRLFAVDNDPDASPPCRLLHIVAGGDYGHRYEYGRAGVHPLQAWDGELPGTLPMVCGVGEAPTAIVFHRGRLWVTSWGDHRIERYNLVPRNASFGAEREAVVQGDEDFRPTGMAVAPDGNLWFGDWVKRDYAVHGNGRLWRLSPAIDAPLRNEPPIAENEAVVNVFGGIPRKFAHRYDDPTSPAPDPFVLANDEAMTVPKDSDVVNRAMAWWKSPSSTARSRMGDLRIARNGWRVHDSPRGPLLLLALADPDRDVRLYAVRWIADERLSELRDDVAKLLAGPMPDERYFLCVLAALEWLDGDASMRSSGISDGLLARELRNKSRSPELHALALRLISPDHKSVTIARLREYLQSSCAPLRLEAVRTLAARSAPDRFTELARVAADDSFDDECRATAAAGLGADVAAHGELLAKLAAGGETTWAAEARRALRLAGKTPATVEEKPAATDLAAWEKLLAEGGDAASGRRLYFGPLGPRCAACHQRSGRGGRVGPDLTKIGAQQSRERVIASIIQPSREIAPQYEAWALQTADGKSRLGLKLPQGGDDGRETYADPTGASFTLPSDEIELRSPATESLMPAGLEHAMTIADLRDIVAFLTESSGK